MKKVALISVCCLIGFCARPQSVTGFLSIKPSTVALGCGCTGCNDAAYIAGVTYPDPAGGCGTSEPSANSGGCSVLSKSAAIVVPDGCTVTINACFGDRPGCTGTSPGPGLDSGDQFSIVGAGGTQNCNSGIVTGASNTSTCISLTQVGGTVTMNITANRVSEMLTYTMSYSGPSCTPGPLPIELLHFSVTRNPGSFLLDWATISETNSRDFEIEYSSQGTLFSSLSRIPAAGKSRSLKNYSITLNDTLPATNHYFRLRQNDLDGTFAYSNIVYVGDIADIDLKVFPNPSQSGMFVLNSSTFTSGDSDYEVLDFTGNVVVKQPMNSTRSYIDLSAQSKGVYLIRLREGRKYSAKKVVFN